MKQVLIRRALANQQGNQLIRAEVLSERDGILRVMFPNQLKPVEVRAVDTIPATQVFGNILSNNPSDTVIQRSYPTSPNCLVNLNSNR